MSSLLQKFFGSMPKTEATQETQEKKIRRGEKHQRADIDVKAIVIILLAAGLSGKQVIGEMKKARINMFGVTPTVISRMKSLKQELKFAENLKKLGLGISLQK